jgi:hypothetical protein
MTDAPITPEAATARLSELQGDAGFREKLLSGDAEARRTFDGLMSAKHGVASKGGTSSTPSALTASGDLGLPALTPQEASAKLTELRSDRSWAERWLAGDHIARKEYNELMAAASGDRFANAMAGASSPDFEVTGPGPGQLSTSHLKMWIDDARSIGVPDEALEELNSGDPIDAGTKQEAEVKRNDLMTDPDFVKRYLAGGVEERRTMALLNIIKLAPVAA